MTTHLATPPPAETIARMRALLERATEMALPWSSQEHPHSGHSLVADSNAIVVADCGNASCLTPEQEDFRASLIVEAVNALPSLLLHIEALTAELAEARGALEPFAREAERAAVVAFIRADAELSRRMAVRVRDGSLPGELNARSFEADERKIDMLADAIARGDHLPKDQK